MAEVERLKSWFLLRMIMDTHSGTMNIQSSLDTLRLTSESHVSVRRLELANQNIRLLSFHCPSMSTIWIKSSFQLILIGDITCLRESGVRNVCLIAMVRPCFPWQPVAAETHLYHQSSVLTRDTGIDFLK
jgi:hypothetical protein